MLTSKDRTKLINKLQRKYPGTRRQRTSHGAGRYSVQFILAGKVVADFTLPV